MMNNIVKPLPHGSIQNFEQYSDIPEGDIVILVEYSFNEDKIDPSIIKVKYLRKVGDKRFSEEFMEELNERFFSKKAEENNSLEGIYMFTDFTKTLEYIASINKWIYEKELKVNNGKG